MSRMGKQPIDLVANVNVEIAEQNVSVTGPKGTLTYELPDYVVVSREDARLQVATDPPADIKPQTLRKLNAAHGLARSLLQGMVTGVSEGFTKRLEFQGVGYRGQVKGQHLTINLGFSHPVEFDVPENVQVSMPDQTHIVLEGIDKQAVGQVAATIRGFRPPDVYKGKGIRYQGEQISLKEGKTVG